MGSGHPKIGRPRGAKEYVDTTHPSFISDHELNVELLFLIAWVNTHKHPHPLNHTKTENLHLYHLHRMTCHAWAPLPNKSTFDHEALYIHNLVPTVADWEWPTGN